MTKHILITGATDGIGKATAHALATRGITLVIVGRNPDKTQQVAQEITAATYNKNVHYLIADLSSQADIRRLVTDYQAQFGRLDVLINNAGGYFYHRQESVDGIEYTFALNHLGYFMLTGLLFPLLQATEGVRIINVASEAHRYKRDGILFDDLQTAHHYNAMKAYSLSKLANIMFTYELAKRLDRQSVTVNALHPGFVRTAFTQNAHQIAHRIFNWLSKLWAISPEDGAKTSVYLATSDEVRDVSGKYFIKSKPTDSNDASYDEAQWEKLWQISLDMTGIPDFPN